MTENRETHGRTMRVGRSASSKYGYKADVSSDHIIGTTTSSKVKSRRWARKFQPEVNNRTKQKTEQKKKEKKYLVCDQKDSLFTSVCFFFLECFSSSVARAKTKLRGTRVCERSFVGSLRSSTRFSQPCLFSCPLARVAESESPLSGYCWCLRR